MIRLHVLAEPFGKQRARSRPGGKPYTPAKTIREELRIRRAWEEQSGYTFPAGLPLEIHVHARLARPQAHLRVNGELASAGLRSVWPTKKPDWDNLGKLVGDALNGFAYHDDAQIVYARISKTWSDPADPPSVTIVVLEAAP